MTTILQSRHCLVQKRITYNRPRWNDGQTEFYPGDDIFVAIEDFQRLLKHGKIRAVEDTITDRELVEIDFNETFPRRSNKIWVFGDGPTAPAAKDFIGDDDIVFAVNHCFYSPLSLTPDYYVALDNGMLEKEQEKIENLGALRVFTNANNIVLAEMGIKGHGVVCGFNVIGESGFSSNLLEIYHGKTSIYCALQLAVQCGREFVGKGLEIHLAGIDLAVLERADSSGKLQTLTHHYGQTNYHEELFPRMLSSIRYGLNYLNERGIKWYNYSPLLASRIQDLERGENGA